MVSIGRSIWSGRRCVRCGGGGEGASGRTRRPRGRSNGGGKSPGSVVLDAVVVVVVKILAWIEWAVSAIYPEGGEHR